ncbi:MAG: MoxR family ATPase [Ancrocorticia sp.]
MSIEKKNSHWFATVFERLTRNIGKAILGKEDVIHLALTCMFSEGHLLLEDAPGMGKTALARAIAATVSGTNSRIQFTPDLLPSDITGTNVYNQRTGSWDFHRGPIFASIVLADEINRASPKTQSALLEVMEESHVTIDGERYDTGRPFMVIATQNPIDQAGTYRLPEAQLDRFLMKTALGYPSGDAGVEILLGSATPDRSRMLDSIISTAEVAELASIAGRNHVDRSLARYIQDLCEATREDVNVRIGVSTRGAIAMTRAARVWAMAQERDYVVPDDIKALAAHVWSHRLVLDPDAEFDGVSREEIIETVVRRIPAPAVRG